MSGRSRRCAVTLLAALAALVASARAEPYETFLDVETEQDLLDALAAHLIGGETWIRLRGLLARRVDLDGAQREELYELPNLTYAEVDAIIAQRTRGVALGDGTSLVASGVLTQLQLDAIAPFLATSGLNAGLAPGQRWAGWAQLATRVAHLDRELPSAALRVRGVARGGVRAALALAWVRARPGLAVFDPTRQALAVEAPVPHIELAKGYLRWQRGALTALVGSYRAGFGQRVTFDDTGAAQPSGFVEDDEVAPGSGLVRTCLEAPGEVAPSCRAMGGAQRSVDVQWREGLVGAALAVRRALGDDRQLAVHVFTSLAPRGAAPADVVAARTCADEAGAECSPLPVLLASGAARLAPAPRLAAGRLPAVLADRLLGGHVALSAGRRWRLGLTGYGSRLRGLVEGAGLIPRLHDRWPRGRFGALGIELGVTGGGLELGGEVAHSLDAAGRGGVGAVARALWARAARELALTARYYAPSFDNPFARPVSAADEVEGQRARDEAGLTARYARSSAAGSLRLGLDAWSPVSAARPALALGARGERALGAVGRAAVSLAYEDKDVRAGGRDECFSGGRDDAPCRGGRLVSAGRLGLALGAAELSLQVAHELVDAGGGPRRQALSGWLVARGRHGASALRAHLRLRQDDLGAARAPSASAALELGRSLADSVAVRVRADGSAAALGAAPAGVVASLWLSVEVGL